MQYTEQVNRALKTAKAEAEQCGQKYIGSEHLLLGLIREERGMAYAVLKECKVSEEKLTELISELIVPEGQVKSPDPVKYSPRAESILEQAEREAEFFGQKEVGTEHLLLAILKDVDSVATRLLHTMGIPVQKLFMMVLDSLGLEEKNYKDYMKTVKGGTKGASESILEQYSRNLTVQAEKGKLDPVVGREQEIQRVIQILSRRSKNNPCLIGEPGVGKTAIVEGLAQRIVTGNVPKTIREKQIFTLDMAGMVAGSKYRGEFEERMKKVIEEVAERPDVLLFIDELHTIIGAGGAEGAMDASNILKPALSRGEMQLIGATTIGEYRKYIEKDPALERRFQAVVVEEPKEEEAVEILKGLRHNYEAHHHVVISDEAIEAAVKYSERYINDRYLPDKAIDLIDEASARKQLDGDGMTEKMEVLHREMEECAGKKEKAVIAGDWDQAREWNQKQSEAAKKLADAEKKRNRRENSRPVVGEEDIGRIVSMWTRIPVQKLAEKETQRLRRLEQTLKRRVIGQDEAVCAVAKAIKRGRVGLKDPKRPIGSFLFLGPTGVGKTELSKVLADVVFGSEQAMIRVDMSEYMEKHSVSRLVGSPPGYVGYEEGGQLSEKVRRNPYSVILFDEIEKAHPDVFNILLQVLDDGHITDSQGRKIDFKNTILIMTSNAGAKAIMEPKKLGFTAVDDEKYNYERMKSGVMEEVRRVFKPEFLNRIDETIVFHSLNREEIRKIVTLLLRDFEKRCKEQMDITLTVRDSVKNHIAETGYDPKYGARPLKRAIQTKLEDALAEEILDGNIKRGDQVAVGYVKNKIRFSTAH